MRSESQLYNISCIVDKTGVCSGCGVCAGVCPANVLSIEWNEFGEYVPKEYTSGCMDCGMCLKVCPFIGYNDSEMMLAKEAFSDQETIKFDPVVGYYSDLFAGYSIKYRHSRSSGGLTTWFLEKLFEEKMIDAVCCVRSNENSEKLFTSYIARSAQDLKESSRSAYYPVEFSWCVKEILKSNMRYAFVGLPCVIKALRLAIKQKPGLATHISVLVGLACGQQKSKFFTEYVCLLAGGDPAKIKKASFRVKDIKRHHLDHRFECECESKDGGGHFFGHIYQSEGMSRVWGQDCFKLKACNFCDDILAETADITFGDAIEEPYCFGVEGSNFVIVRSKVYSDIFMRHKNNREIELHNAKLSAVVARQKGVMLLKRSDLAHRLFLLHEKDVKDSYIYKRVTPRKRNNFFLNQYMNMRDSMRHVSRNIYARYRNDRDVLHYLQRALLRVRCKYPVVFIGEALLSIKQKLLSRRISES